MTLDDLKRPLLFRASSINLVGHLFPIDGLITVLRSLEKQLPDVYVAIGTYIMGPMICVA